MDRGRRARRRRLLRNQSRARRGAHEGDARMKLRPWLVACFVVVLAACGHHEGQPRPRPHRSVLDIPKGDGGAAKKPSVKDRVDAALARRDPPRWTRADLLAT